MESTSPHAEAPIETIAIPSFPKKKVDSPVVITKQDGTTIGVLVSIEEFEEMQSVKESEAEKPTKIEAFMETVRKANKNAVESDVDEEDYYKQYL